MGRIYMHNCIKYLVLLFANFDDDSGKRNEKFWQLMITQHQSNPITSIELIIWLVSGDFNARNQMLLKHRTGMHLHKSGIWNEKWESNARICWLCFVQVYLAVISVSAFGRWKFKLWMDLRFIIAVFFFVAFMKKNSIPIHQMHGHVNIKLK